MYHPTEMISDAKKIFLDTVTKQLFFLTARFLATIFFFVLQEINSRAKKNILAAKKKIPLLYQENFSWHQKTLL